MAKEICISSTPHETRLAILEDDQLAEIYYERENEYTLAGSIYNGRVTRVLPGMQSAFVDIGLERDAFLYVTDFVELEDQEDSDEVEKAAESGANLAPREIQHSSGQRQNGLQDGLNDKRGDRSRQRQEQKPQQLLSDPRTPRDRRPAAESVPLVVEEVSSSPELPASTAEGADAEGTTGRRWRGRRHRRGGRGQGQAPEPGAEQESSTAPEPEASADFETTTEIHASAGDQGRARPDRKSSGRQPFAQEPIESPRGGSSTPAPFLLPGESLSKYGASSPSSSADQTGAVEESAAPAKPSYTSRPSTLIEAPLAWDGSGLLPGESISRHRERGPEPVEDSSSPAPHEIAGSASHEAVHEFSEDDSEEHFESVLSNEQVASDDMEEETLAAPTQEFQAHEFQAHEHPAHAVQEHEAHPSHQEPEPDASASHNIDPAPPTGFRLLDLLTGKKKKEPAAPARSSYAPGEGHVEEELIEGEELDGGLHARRHKADDHDLDVYEEETLPAQARAGALGELLHEARIEARGADEEVDFDEDEEEEGAAVSAPAAPGQRRVDRNARGRRGRAPQQNNRRGPSRRSMQMSDLPIISDLLKPGQEILVQIAKEPIAKKGARITSHIALPGRFLVFMPTVTHVGVSRKIESDEERHRLKRILVHERGESTGGFIVRTAAEGASEEELRADLRFLIHLWDEIKNRSESSKSPALIYHDLSLIERILRDQVSANFANIWVDSEADYERIVRFLNRFSPTLVRRVKLYTKEVPLFEHFGIQDEISKALRSKVWLKSGGSIVINQTEALVAIDINTGKYVGKSARLEDTIVKTNLDAVPEIVRQIRLRDLGGIIVIDFIDMDDRKNRFKVLAALEEALKTDRAPTKVLQFNDFGLVAITRKRVKQSLERTLSVPCPTCQATGMVKSPATVCNEIYVELRKMKKHFEGADIMLRVHPETVKVLKSSNGSWITEFEELVGRNVLVKSDPTLHPEQFDVQG
jgi:ribonuclease G